MTLEKIWSVSVGGNKEENPSELMGLVGLWNSQIQITISNPSVVQEGPIVRHINPQSRNPNKLPAISINRIK
jgi:hypothetical protein